jgi:hypothetical protein
VVSLLLGLVLGIMIALALPDQAEADQSALASTDAPGYLLSDFSIEYPYPQPGRSEADQGIAGVRFTTTWVGNSFPGQATCQLTVFDTSGANEGGLEFDAMALPNPALAGPLRVSVSGEPVSAKGTCGPGSYPGGRGYDLQLTSIQAHEQGHSDKSTLMFRVNWVGMVDPVARSCEVVGTLRDETTFSQTYTISAPDGTLIDLNAAHPRGDIVDADVTCSPVWGSHTGSHGAEDYWFALERNPCSVCPRSGKRRVAHEGHRC